MPGDGMAGAEFGIAEDAVAIACRRTDLLADRRIPTLADDIKRLRSAKND